MRYSSFVVSFVHPWVAHNQLLCAYRGTVLPPFKISMAGANRGIVASCKQLVAFVDVHGKLIASVAAATATAWYVKNAHERVIDALKHTHESDIKVLNIKNEGLKKCHEMREKGLEELLSTERQRHASCQERLSAARQEHERAMRQLRREKEELKAAYESRLARAKPGPGRR